ncbi:MAG: hypothetical protein JO306_03625, partial [Gemmatimonadetes bacterium]|nr:hypothetical protein [Gemmatimonadota bacterium]
MDAIQLLNDAELPKQAQHGTPYLEQLATTLADYVTAAAGLTGNDVVSRGILDRIDAIKALGEHLLRVHENVLCGRMAHARQEMERAIETVRPELEIATSIPLDRRAVGTL